MNWTKRKPPKRVKEHWFWWRHSKESPAVLVCVGVQGVSTKLQVVWFAGERQLIDSIGGEWSDEPIPEPKES